MVVTSTQGVPRKREGSDGLPHQFGPKPGKSERGLSSNNVKSKGKWGACTLLHITQSDSACLAGHPALLIFAIVDIQ
jgi:hypothetical protein